jgi:hypothetical protein
MRFYNDASPTDFAVFKLLASRNNERVDVRCYDWIGEHSRHGCRVRRPRRTPESPASWIMVVLLALRGSVCRSATNPICVPVKGWNSLRRATSAHGGRAPLQFDFRHRQTVLFCSFSLQRGQISFDLDKKNHFSTLVQDGLTLV